MRRLGRFNQAADNAVNVAFQPHPVLREHNLTLLVINQAAGHGQVADDDIFHHIAQLAAAHAGWLVARGRGASDNAGRARPAQPQPPVAAYGRLGVHRSRYRLEKRQVSHYQETAAFG